MSKNYKLGPQGKAIQQRMLHGANAPINSTFLSGNYPNQLDYLINDLQNPNATMTVEKVLSYMAHYVPSIKIDYNLKLVVAAFLDNTICFPRSPSLVNFEKHYLMIEAFGFIFERKLLISQPSLSVCDFYDIFGREITNFFKTNKAVNCWKVIPLISGILLANTTRDKFMAPENVIFFKKFDRNLTGCLEEALTVVFKHHTNYYNIIASSLVSLSCSFMDLSSEFKTNLPHDLILHSCVNLIFESPAGLIGFENSIPSLPDFRAFMSTPVLKHLNRLSFLIENCYLHIRKADDIDISLNKYLLFNEKLNFFMSDKNVLKFDDVIWSFLKQLLFSQVIIFQGICSRSMEVSSAKFIKRQFPHFFRKILSNLFQLNFILTKVGTGGFESYNFVYFISTNALLQYNPLLLESLSTFLIGDSNLLQYQNYITRSKILFSLGIWEQSINSCSSNLRRSYIFPVCEFVTDTNNVQDQEIIEAGHSVLLEYYASENLSTESESHILSYSKKVLSQFPHILSPIQVNIAIETLAKKLLLDNSHLSFEFLDFLYVECFITNPGISIPDLKTNDNTGGLMSVIPAITILNTPAFEDVSAKAKDEQPSGTAVPATVREGLISMLINTIPYVRVDSFEFWLNRISLLIQSSSPHERKYLTNYFWKVISEKLDISRSNVGISWWYGVRSQFKDSVRAHI